MNSKELRRIIEHTSTFLNGSTNQAVALALLDGKWHSRSDLAYEFGIKPENVNYVVGKLKEIGARVERGDVPPEPGEPGAAGAKWCIIFEDLTGPAIKRVASLDGELRFTVGSRRYMIESVPAGLLVKTPESEVVV